MELDMTEHYCPLGVMREIKENVSVIIWGEHCNEAHVKASIKLQRTELAVLQLITMEVSECEGDYSNSTDEMDKKA
ncbi:hypothetical protein DPEC_G00166820 [Dallia pectoralis]|uniref:Uncharacterized protein n=1 Tax=Dallia pectoralis TaxID=75939 RepID=A0ACC2GI96_DALPE|nr:hypothetical protein DPEC_G00166820 [Dallia pectoralis]